MTLWWEQRSQPRLSLCQEYRVRDPSLLIARERFGRNVRFIPESGHRRAAVGCPLSAKSGHRQIFQLWVM
jgi:hypothetical protein